MSTDTAPASDGTRSGLPRWVMPAAIIAGVAVLLLAVGITVALLTGRTSPWGQSAASAARKYTTCVTPLDSGSVARCGDFQVVTSSNQAEQDYFVAMLKDQGGECWIAVPGVVVVSNRVDSLVAAVGESPASWADDHNGETGCA